MKKKGLKVTSALAVLSIVGTISSTASADPRRRIGRDYRVAPVRKHVPSVTKRERKFSRIGTRACLFNNNNNHNHNNNASSRRPAPSVRRIGRGSFRN